MRRKRLIQPTFGNGCRHDKTRKRRIRHRAPIAGCGVNALSGLRSATAVETRKRRIRHRAPIAGCGVNALSGLQSATVVVA
ncbi:TPA: hypothetical protein NWA32_001045 [Escherichia coli]|nr:hypothetical protein [Escherichia coli]